MRTIVFSLFLSLVLTPRFSGQVSFTATPSVCAQSTVNLVANSGTNAVSGYSWSVLPAGPVFAAVNASATGLFFSVAGNYTIQLSAQTGTTLATTSATIAVLPLPVIQLAVSGNTTCITTNAGVNNPVPLSKPVDIVSTGAVSYSIQPHVVVLDVIISNTFTVRPPASTCYTVTGTDANGCIGSNVKCLTVIPQFTLQALANNTVMCMSDSVQLGVVNAQGNFVGTLQQLAYDWYEPATAPPPSLDSYGTQYVWAYPVNAATYTVEAHDMRACASVPALITVSISACLGLEDVLMANNGVIAFPNPVLEFVSFRFKGARAEFRMSDVTGRILLSYPIIEPEQKLDVSGLPPGLYLAHLKADGEWQRIRIVKN